MSLATNLNVFAAEESGTRLASWYGEEHRGKLMANGKRFDPDAFTAASWFYPLGTKLRVTLVSASKPEPEPGRLESTPKSLSDSLAAEKTPLPASVIVTVTDRGPARRFVREGRVIDLSRAAFKRLANPNLGLIQVTVEAINDSEPLLAVASSSPLSP
jgi:rare lipoprotein A